MFKFKLCPVARSKQAVEFRAKEVEESSAIEMLFSFAEKADKFCSGDSACANIRRMRFNWAMYQFAYFKLQSTEEYLEDMLPVESDGPQVLVYSITSSYHASLEAPGVLLGFTTGRQERNPCPVGRNLLFGPFTVVKRDKGSVTLLYMEQDVDGFYEYICFDFQFQE